MSENRHFTVVETYYHVRSTIEGEGEQAADYLFTKNQLDVARSRAAEKPHILPKAAEEPLPPAMPNLPKVRPTFMKKWFEWVKK